jgi:hypothetical protein
LIRSIFSSIVRNMDSEIESSAFPPSATLDSDKARLIKGISARTTWAYTRLARDREREYHRTTKIKYCIL